GVPRALGHCQLPTWHRDNSRKYWCRKSAVRRSLYQVPTNWVVAGMEVQDCKKTGHKLTCPSRKSCYQVWRLYWFQEISRLRSSRDVSQNRSTGDYRCPPDFQVARHDKWKEQPGKGAVH